MSAVEYVYKIQTDEPPPVEDMPEALPLSELDKHDGFIHLSNAARIPITAGLFFSREDRIYLIRVKMNARQSGEFRWVEDEGLKGCVHLHGGQLGRHNVAEWKEVVKQPVDDWKEVLGGLEYWLVDA